MPIERVMNAALLATVLSTSASASAQDEAMSYTYIDGGYVNTEIDHPLNVDGDGLGVRGSFAITDRVFLLGDYTSQDLDYNIDFDQLEVGVGGHMPLADALDVVGSVSYLYTDVDVGPGDTDDNAIGLGLGLRGQLTDRLEIEGGVQYADVNVLRDDLLVSFGGRYYVTPQFALGAGVEAGDDMSMWNMGVRYEFR